MMGYGETLSSSDSKEFGNELKDVENKETDITFSSKNCNSDNLNREIMSGMETNVD